MEAPPPPPPAPGCLLPQLQAPLSSPLRQARVEALTLDGVAIEDLCLDFTLPGYEDIPLKVCGREGGRWGGREGG